MDKTLGQRIGFTALLVGGTLAFFQFMGNAVKGYIPTDSLFYWWGFQWFNPASETEHGPLILGLALVLWGWNSMRFQEIPAQPAPGKGLGLFLVGIGLHLLGYMATQTRISIVGFLVTVVGLAFLLGGERIGRAAIFPAFLMLFAIPLEFLTNEIGFPMRMGVIKVATTFSHWVGFEVVQQGTFLYSPDQSYRYDVAPACSGIRSLVALTALSLLIGYTSFRSFWRRTLLLVLALPFAFVGNVIRISAIIVAAEWFGQEAGAVVHDWFGFLIFLIALGFSLGTVSLLDRFAPEPVEQGGGDALKREDRWVLLRRGVAPPSRQSLLKYGAGCFLMLGLAGLWMGQVDRIRPEGLAGVYLNKNGVNPRPMPSMLGMDWLGKRAEVTPVEREVLPPDTGFSRMHYLYAEDYRQSVYLSVVLSGMDRTSIHRPELCLVGQGWSLKGSFQHVFTLPDMEYGLPVTVLRLEGGEGQNGRALYAYWFVSGDHIAPTHHERMLHTALDRVFSLKAERWAYITAMTSVRESEQDALARLQTVLALALPDIQRTGYVDQQVNSGE